MIANAGSVAAGAFAPARREASVLVIAPAFPPVSGDYGEGIEELCIEFIKRGIAVTVATWETPGRAPSDRPGLHIVSLQRNSEIDGVPAWMVVIRRLVGSGLFSTCILFANPEDILTWSLINATIPATTRLLVRLLLDRSDALNALKEPSLRQRMVEILKQATATLLLTRCGPDRQFVDAENLPAIYVPHAVGQNQPASDFRMLHDISKNAFVVLLPGEIGRAKNQLGLIQTLQGVPEDWAIVFASPAHPERAESPLETRFAGLLSGRNRFCYIPGLDPDGMAGAIEACDVMACTSQQEYSSRDIVAAMSHGRPWLAAPECAIAADCAGGVSAPLSDFRETLASLRTRADLRLRLGEAGRRHWKQCFSWDAAMVAWMELVTSGKTASAFAVPADVGSEMRELNQEIREAVHADRQSFVHAFRPRQEGFSFCIITDGQEPDKLRLEIESIRAQQPENCEILLGGAVPEGFNDVHCFAMTEAAQGGRLGYMRNRLVEQTRFSVIVVADDDMIFHPGFTKGILAYPDDYDVLCVKILNTDGTRFWDWAVYGSPTGHHLIDYAATDPYVYVTGGMCVMRSWVPRLVQWSDSLGFYQFEDIDFSRKINAQGLRIRFCGECAVTHNDERYYGNNYQVGKKTDPPLLTAPPPFFATPGTGKPL